MRMSTGNDKVNYGVLFSFCFKLCCGLAFFASIMTIIW
jgi:hypothetical protein